MTTEKRSLLLTVAVAFSLVILFSVPVDARFTLLYPKQNLNPPSRQIRVEYGKSISPTVIDRIAYLLNQVPSGRVDTFQLYTHVSIDRQLKVREWM